MEWRLVDGTGAPFDTGEDVYPLYDREAVALEQLALYQDELGTDDGGLHLEVRVVGPWNSLEAGKRASQ